MTWDISNYAQENEQEMWDEIVANDPGPQDFAPAAVAAATPETAAASWATVKDVPEGNVECDGCRGDGVFYGAGRVENGIFIGFKGTCFRCGGKGSQTPSDVARNRTYDAHRVVRI